MTTEEEEDAADVSVYVYAEQVAGKMPHTDDVKREIAQELCDVRAEVAKLYRAIVSCNYPHADHLIRALASRMGFVA